VCIYWSFEGSPADSVLLSRAFRHSPGISPLASLSDAQALLIQCLETVLERLTAPFPPISGSVL
jgi:hypothetical protein